MERYFILANPETLETVCAPFETQPENSLPYFENEFIKPIFDTYPNPKNVIEGIDEKDLNDLLDEQRGKTIKEAYEQRKADGWNAYQEFRANMVKEIYDGTITKQQAFIIEDFLGKGYDKIAQQGDWETAYYKLSTAVIPDTYAFVNSYLNEAKRIMLAYIQANYKPM